MKITLNGTIVDTECKTLLELLLKEHFIESKEKIFGIAVSVNESIVSKKIFSEYFLKEQDVVEIFTMVAGG